MTKKMSLFSLSLPIFIESGLMTLMGSASTFMLGRYSSSAMAGVSVSNQIWMVLFIMYGFINSGTGVLVSQALGAKKKEKALEVIVVSLAMNLAFSLFIGIIMFFFSENLIQMIGVPKDALPYSVDFLRIVGTVSFIDALMLVTSTSLRSFGYTKETMLVNMVLNILNIIGCYSVLFHPFGIQSYGVKGVAYVFVSVHFIGLLVMFSVLMNRIHGKLPLCVLKNFPIETAKGILRIGLPSAGENLSWAASQVVITSLITSLGTEAIAAKTYTETLGWYVNILTNSIAQGTQIMIGHYIGAKKQDEAYKLCLKSHKIAFVCAFVTSAILWVYCKQILSLFTDDVTIIVLSSSIMVLLMILEPGRTFNVVIISSLVATGDVKFPLAMGLIFMWVIALGLSWLLGIHFAWGLMGVFIAYCADEWIRGILMLFRWRSKKWIGKAIIQQT